MPLYVMILNAQGPASPVGGGGGRGATANDPIAINISRSIKVGACLLGCLRSWNGHGTHCHCSNYRQRQQYIMRRKHVLNQRRLPCLPHQCMYGVSAYYNCEHWLVPRLDQGVDRGRHDRTPWLDYQLHSSDTSMTPYHCRSSAHQRYLLVWLCLSSAAAAVAEAQHDPFQPCHFPDFDGAVQRFSKALTYKTLSDAKAKDHVVDPSQFAELDAHLSQAYAQV